MLKFIKNYHHIFVILFSTIILFVCLRGIIGNPNENQINNKEWKESGPFELSPERGRFALTYSIVENKALHFSVPLAKFVSPDVAYSGGNYVSLFPPATSYLVIPGYLIGKAFGVSQIGSFFVISVIAILNMLLIRSIVNKLTDTVLAGTVAGLVFLFATPAFAYAVNLYQHHITTFIILFSIYLLMKFKSLIAITVVLFLCAFSIPVDNPNIIFLFPIGLYALSQLIIVEKNEFHTKLHVRYLGIFSIFFATIPLISLLIYNTASHNQPFKLSGTLSIVQQIDENGNPVLKVPEPVSNLADNLDENAKKKTASAFFKSRNLLNGMFVHLFSPDRGVIFYTPVVLLGLLGLTLFPKNYRNIKTLIAAVAAAVFLLYSLWGDPWGGWAFGDRYMIPAYAMLCILLGTALKYISKKLILNILFVVLLIYSIGVNSLGAITTSANPPEGEARALSEISGKVEKWGYDRNWQYLYANGSKSFFYKTYLSRSMDPVTFYFLITGTVSVFTVTTYFLYIFSLRKHKL